MKIDKVFIEKKEDINKIEYEKRTSVIRNPDGSTVFEMNDVIVPKNWSQVATDIIAQKYFRKAGIPKFLKKVNEENIPPLAVNAAPEMAVPKKFLLLIVIAYRVWFPSGVPAM